MKSNFVFNRVPDNRKITFFYITGNSVFYLISIKFKGFDLKKMLIVFLIKYSV